MTKLFLKPVSINIYTMVQVEVSNTCIDMSVNNGSEKWTGKNTATTTNLRCVTSQKNKEVIWTSVEEVNLQVSLFDAQNRFL